jgi:flagellum-specific peptidoglycan hydrolase FlgJ
MTEAQRLFLAQVRAAAERLQADDIPVAVVIAQAILESGWGQSALAKNGNALFGIKADPAWRGRVYSGTTREYEGGQYITYPGSGRVYPDRLAALADGQHEASLFRAYASFDESIRDHADFLRKNPRYRDCLEAYRRQRDAFAFAQCIHRAGYATGPAYAANLIRLMEQVTPDLVGIGSQAPPTVLIGDHSLPADAVRFERGETWVKLRPAFEAAGWTVAWDESAKTIRVSRP